MSQNPAIDMSIYDDPAYMESIKTEQKAMENKEYGGNISAFDKDVLNAWKISVFKPHDGQNIIRILPRKTPGYFGHTVFIHSYVGPNNDNFVCPAKNDTIFGRKETCPLCARSAALRQAGNDEAAKKFNAWPPRELFILIDCTNQESMNKGIQVWLAPISFNETLTILSNTATQGIINVAHPLRGKLVTFVKKGKGKTGTEYLGLALAEQPFAFNPGWLQCYPDFKDLLQWPDFKMMEGVVGAVNYAPAGGGAPVNYGEPAPTTTAGPSFAAPNVNVPVGTQAAVDAMKSHFGGAGAATPAPNISPPVQPVAPVMQMPNMTPTAPTMPAPNFAAPTQQMPSNNGPVIQPPTTPAGSKFREEMRGVIGAPAAQPPQQ